MANLLAYLPYPRHPTASFAGQPCTKEHAGVADNIAIDVGVTIGSARAAGWRPLERGETCGGKGLIVACDSGKSSSKCSKDPVFDEHWKLVIGLNVVDSGRVNAYLAVQPYKALAPGFSTMSPCGVRRVVVEKRGGVWVEVPANSKKRPPSSSPPPPPNL